MTLPKNSILNVSKNSEKICGYSHHMNVQSLKIAGANSKYTLRNKKDKFSMNSDVLNLFFDTIHAEFVFFCFSMYISNLDLKFLGIVHSCDVNIHNFFQNFLKHLKLNFLVKSPCDFACQSHWISVHLIGHHRVVINGPIF